MTKKKYEGKYAEMAERFRKDGCDEYTVEKFIRQQMEADEFEKGYGTTDIEAITEWKKIPEDVRDMLLHNAFCRNCGEATFKPGYNLRLDKFGVVIEGFCDKCGGRICRCCY